MSECRIEYGIDAVHSSDALSTAVATSSLLWPCFIMNTSKLFKFLTNI